MALCVIEEGAEVSEQEIIDLCADQLGSYKKPSAVQFRTTPLPKSPVGKVQRKVLREPFWEGHERRVSGNCRVVRDTTRSPTSSSGEIAGRYRPASNPGVRRPPSAGVRTTGQPK